MVITQVKAGLGNQLFQYAAGKSLAAKLGTELKLDLSWYESDTSDIKRDYLLDQFHIKAKRANPTDLNKFIRYTRPPFDKFPRVLPLITRTRIFREKHFHFDPDFYKLKGNVYLQGFWPSEKYFAPAEKLIRKELTPKKNFGEKIKQMIDAIKKNESVSLHIRRGDYVANKQTNTYHGVLTIPYYKKGVEVLQQITTKPIYYVFSDDIMWCKKSMKFLKHAVYVSGATPVEDMYLMSCCKHNIIANSTFSWWGAWLNTNPEKTVIAPKKWFNEAPYDTKDLIPKRWKRI